jgi:hypothetical protein
MKKLVYLVLAGALVMTSCKPTEEEPKVESTETTFTETSLIDKDTVKFVSINDNGNGIGTYTMKKNKVYVLDGFVFVNEGQTLTIEPGTIIKGKSGQGENASALVVAKGGKIMAEGTSTEPIIFTAEADQTSRSINGKLIGSDNLGTTTGGLWGGLIVLGKAGLNSNPGTTAIEGIPTTEKRGIYGGTDDADNSGILKYVSIRHGGTNIGAGNEINGLTLGGVGSGTTIDYIEVIANGDDGVEFFGGTVQAKHMLMVNNQDDSFDYDEGFRGKGQFWVSINPSDRSGEHDGGTNPETATPYATPIISNVTYIGGNSLTFRDNAGGYYYNSIFESLNKNPVIDIEDLLESAGDDSKKQFEAGRLKIENNIFANAKGLNVAYLVYDAAGKGTAGTTEIGGTTNTTSGSIVSASNPVPATITSATSTSAKDSWFTNAPYIGAFDGTTNWAAGWTLTFPTK